MIINIVNNVNANENCTSLKRCFICSLINLPSSLKAILIAGCSHWALLNPEWTNGWPASTWHHQTGPTTSSQYRAATSVMVTQSSSSESMACRARRRGLLTNWCGTMQSSLPKILTDGRDKINSFKHHSYIKLENLPQILCV